MAECLHCARRRSKQWKSSTRKHIWKRFFKIQSRFLWSHCKRHSITSRCRRQVWTITKFGTGNSKLCCHFAMVIYSPIKLPGWCFFLVHSPIWRFFKRFKESGLDPLHGEVLNKAFEIFSAFLSQIIKGVTPLKVWHHHFRILKSQTNSMNDFGLCKISAIISHDYIYEQKCKIFPTNFLAYAPVA